MKQDVESFEDEVADDMYKGKQKGNPQVHRKLYSQGGAGVNPDGGETNQANEEHQEYEIKPGNSKYDTKPSKGKGNTTYEKGNSKSKGHGKYDSHGYGSYDSYGYGKSSSKGKKGGFGYDLYSNWGGSGYGSYGYGGGGYGPKDTFEERATRANTGTGWKPTLR